MKIWKRKIGVSTPRSLVPCLLRMLCLCELSQWKGKVEGKTRWMLWLQQNSSWLLLAKLRPPPRLPNMTVHRRWWQMWSRQRQSGILGQASGGVGGDNGRRVPSAPPLVSLLDGIDFSYSFHELTTNLIFPIFFFSFCRWRFYSGSICWSFSRYFPWFRWGRDWSGCICSSSFIRDSFGRMWV